MLDEPAGDVERRASIRTLPPAARIVPSISACRPMKVKEPNAPTSTVVPSLIVSTPFWPPPEISVTSPKVEPLNQSEGSTSR